MLLLAATNQEALAARRLARAHGDVARVADAPESLTLRLQRLSRRQPAQIDAQRALELGPLTGSFTRPRQQLK